MNKTQKILLLSAMLISVIMMVFLFSDYQSSRQELSSLKAELNESTENWKRINEEKLVVQSELKETKNALREAELTISEDEEKAEKFESDIAALEKEIEELKKKLPSGE